MTNKEKILRAITFTEKNLGSNISVLHMAREGCCSLYHFTRLFQGITGMSPKKYLLQRRLTESVNELRNSNRKIADIAYDYQFGSHEAFTRAFKKHFGINPSKAKSDKGIHLGHMIPAITQDYIYQSEKVRDQSPSLVHLPRKIVVGISFFISDKRGAIDLSDEWRQFMTGVDKIRNRRTPERFYQVQFWSEEQDLGGLYFLVGVEVENIDDVHPQFVVKVIPQGSYLQFIHKGLSNKVGYTYRYIYQHFLPGTEYRLIYPFNFEFYGEKCLGPYDERSESEIFIPVDLRGAGPKPAGFDHEVREV